MRRVRRSPEPPTTTGIGADRSGIAGGLGQRPAVAVVGLGAGRPEGPHRLDRPARGRRAARGPAGTAMPNAACSRSHQPGADADEGTAAGQRRQGGGGLRGDRRPDGRSPACTRVPSSQAACRAPASSAERHPRLGDRVPGPADLGDLDEVVHQRQAGEARPRRRRGRRRSARPAGPRPTGSGTPAARPAGRGSALRSARVGGAAAGIDGAAGLVGGDLDRRGPSPRASSRGLRRAPCAAGRRAPEPGPGGHARRCGGGTRRPGCRGRRRPPAARTRGPRRARRAASSRRARGCRPPWSGHDRAVRRRSVSSTANASVEASRSCGPLPRTPRRASEETTSSRAVAGRGPGRLPGPRGADEHHERRVGESHAPSLAYLRGPSSPARRAARRRRRTPRRRRT